MTEHTDRELLEQEVKTNLILRDKLERLRVFIDKIEEAATDGQNGSSLYGLDRLTLIRELVEASRRV